MSSLTTYQGVQIVTPTPTGDAGKALNSNFVALATFLDTSDPTSANDASQGFAKGSRWYNTSTKKEFICVDPTVATWTMISSPDFNWAKIISTDGYGPYLSTYSSPATNYYQPNPTSYSLLA